MNFENKIQQIESLRNKLIQGGSESAQNIQHKAGKLTARERVDQLLDPGSFSEVELFSKPIDTGLAIDKKTQRGDGLIAGYGTVKGRSVCVWAQDATVLGGRFGITHGAKMVRLLERAIKAKIPCIGLIDSNGLKAEDLITTPSNYNYDAFMQMQTRASGLIPQISLVMGPCVGAAAVSALLADYVFMVKNTSYLCVGMETAGDEGFKLGNAADHDRKSGCCDFLAQDDQDCLAKVKTLLEFLPLNYNAKSDSIANDDSADREVPELVDLVPVDSRKPYNLRKLIKIVIDNGNFFEIKKNWAANLIVGFGRLAERTVGIIGNNSMVKGGCMDVDAADKLCRMVRFCDAFNIPIIYLADTPAFLPSIKQERKGIIRHGAKTVFANSVTTVPQIQLYIRKCYSGGNLAMPGNNLGGDFGIAWPITELMLMHPEGAVSIIYRKEIAKAKNPREEFKKRLDEFKTAGAVENLWEAMTVQDFIHPKNTRIKMIEILRYLQDKSVESHWNRHDNMPL